MGAFKEFITTFRASLPADKCPMQVDGFSLVYGGGGDSWMYNLIRDYGPLGKVVKNGFQYQGLMVNSVATAGDCFLQWWDGKPYDKNCEIGTTGGPTVTAKINTYDGVLPYTSRVGNFWGYPHETLFVTDASKLFAWMKTNSVSAGWWEWSPSSPSPLMKTNMKLVYEGCGF